MTNDLVPTDLMYSFLTFRPNKDNNNLAEYYYDYFAEQMNQYTHLDIDNFVAELAKIINKLRKNDAVFHILCQTYNYKLNNGVKPRLLDLLDYISNHTYDQFMEEYKFCIALSDAMDWSTKGFYLSNHEIAELKTNFTE